MIDIILWAAFGVETLILLAVIGICIWVTRGKPGPAQGSNKISGPPLPINHNQPPKKYVLPTQAPKGPPPKPTTRHHITVEIDRGNKQ